MKQVTEQKALSACQAYVAWQLEIKRLSHAIGGHLYLCAKARGNNLPVNDTHLAEAYRPDVDEYRTTYMGEAEIMEWLQEVCPHCLEAHKLIQQRKLAKQKFGAAKRWISRLGKIAP